VEQIKKYTVDIFVGIFKIFKDNKGYRRSFFINEVFSYGARSLPMVLIVSFFLGLSLTMQLIPELEKFGASAITGGLVMVPVVRELAPVIMSIIIAGRIGSSMAAELGSMNITNQIDSLTLMAVNPVSYLVSPKVLSSIIMLPSLVIISIIVIGFGSYIVFTSFFSMDSGTYISSVSNMLKVGDVFGSLFKSVCFGFVIAYISCYRGLFLKGRSSEIGQATTDSVAFSIISILMVNLFLSYLIFA
jgi:phospholipid/cholesterol/gamma-HCH transport system permease protein